MTTDKPQIAVVDNPSESRYEVRVNGELAGFSEYRFRDGIITFTHTETFPAFGGRGIGSKLAEFSLDDALARKLDIWVTCPFIAAHIRSHPKYAGLLPKVE